MNTKHCPLEQSIAGALESAGIRFLREDDPGNIAHLDFYLPDHDLYLEVKSGHTPRSSQQLARATNVILVQGVRSVGFLVSHLSVG